MAMCDRDCHVVADGFDVDSGGDIVVEAVIVVAVFEIAFDAGDRSLAYH